MRDKVVDFLNGLKVKTGINQQRLVGGVGVSRSMLYTGKQRYGKANEHND